MKFQRLSGNKVRLIVNTQKIIPGQMNVSLSTSYKALFQHG